MKALTLQLKTLRADAAKRVPGTPVK